MNKPVAWWDGKEPNVLGLAYHQNDYCLIPLYTHPVKENCCPDCGCHFVGEYPFNYKVKELTDEEIIKIMVQFDVYSNDDQCLIEAARAILRKAQE